MQRRFLHRLPWLLLGLGGALLAADLVGSFETHLQLNVMLAFFIPGIVYLADAVGTQTETVVVRGLSLGVPMRRMVGRELLAGVLIGLALAAVAFPFVWWRWNDAGLALSVGVSVFAACSTATLAAMMLPWLFDAFAVGSRLRQRSSRDRRSRSPVHLDLPVGHDVRHVMNQQHRAILQSIAQRAMLERGLLPDLLGGGVRRTPDAFRRPPAPADDVRRQMPRRFAT